MQLMEPGTAGKTRPRRLPGQDFIENEARDFIGDQYGDQYGGRSRVLGNQRPDYGVDLAEMVAFLLNILQGRVNPSSIS